MTNLTLENVDWDRYDFIDLGCSSGGSLKHCQDRFGAERGLGVDIDPAKVATTRAAGFDAIIADARALHLEHRVSFITMLDFFEHLPDLDMVFDILAAAASSARDFLFIKHPSFEGEEAGRASGIKQYWWDWHGHTAHIRVADYCSMFDVLGLSTYRIRYFERVADSAHPSVVPVDAPQDLSAAQAAELSAGDVIEFAQPLWRRQDIFVALRPFSAEEWNTITRPTRQDIKVMTASGQLPADPARWAHLRGDGVEPPWRSADVAANT